MIKVLHIGYTHRYDDIRICTKEAMSLVDAGYDVTFITSDHNSAGEIPPAAPVKKIVLPLISKRFFRWFQYCHDLKRYLKENEYDIYHVHEFYLLPITSWLLNHKKKVIYDMHEDAPKVLDLFVRKRFGIFSNWIFSIIRHFDNKMIEKSSYSIFVVPAQKERVAAHTNHWEMICNFPIIEERHDIQNAEQEKNDAPFICYAGGISEERGITAVISLLPEIKGELLLAGSVSASYLEELKKMDGWSKVHFLGYLNKAEVEDMYAKSKLGVFFARPTPNMLPSYPIKMFEYMEASIPVVCSNFPTWKNIVESAHCGICVPYDDDEQFVQAINRLLENEELREKMGENGRKAVETNYNWNSQKKKLLTAYHQVAATLNR